MSVKAIPEGYHTVTPYLMAEGAADLLTYLERAFGAEVVSKSLHDDGAIMHADLRIGDSHVMVSQARPEWPAMPTGIYLYVDDCDATWRQAVDAGGESLMEPRTEFYGDRMGGVKDPSGNMWWIATHVEDVSPEEMKRREEEWKKARA